MKVINWFTNTASLGIQVLLVVGAVLVFGFIDPFGIVSSEKIKLKDTPIDVESIQEIGELITAEYYGEVVSSFTEEIEEDEEIAVDSFNLYINILKDEFFEIVSELRSETWLQKKKRKVYDEFLKRSIELRQENFYPEFSLYLFKKLEKETVYKNRHFNNSVRDRQEKRLVKGLFALEERVFQKAKNDNALMNDLKDVFSDKTSKENRKLFKKKQLVLLGRGWVKAGYNFKDINPDNFYYNTTTNIVYFIGFEPKILTQTINPWFIPEEEVPGFEFLMYTRGAQRDYSVLQKVKQGCLDKLIANAHKREILSLAKKNAEGHLESLFDILIDGGVKDVVFSGSKFDFGLSIVAHDSIISGEELAMIDSLMTDSTLDLKEEKETFVKKIVGMNVRILDRDDLKYDSTLSELYTYVNDGFITENEKVSIDSSSNPVFDDPYWKQQINSMRYEVADSLRIQ